MENKAFLIDFEAVVNVGGTLQIKAETEAHARLKMAEIIKQALEQEDCIIELDVKNKNAENITIKEIGNAKAVNITGTLSLN